MSLPKLYAPITVTFWTLRNGLGENYGVVYDIDTKVTRKVVRVLCADGWKWQIYNYWKLLEWDWNVEQDQEMLNEYAMEFDFLEAV